MQNKFMKSLIRMAVLLLCTPTVLLSAATLAEQQNTNYGTRVDFQYNASGGYREKYSLYSKSGYTAAEGEGIHIAAKAYTASAAVPEKTADGIIHTEDNEYIDWRFSLENSGLYEIKLTYRALENELGNIKRSLMIDGEIPCDECMGLEFTRLWRDEGEPKVNTAGDQIRPAVYEVYDWQTVTVTDTYYMYGEGLRFYLEAGVHTLRLTAIDCSMELKEIAIVPAVLTESYSKVSKDYDLSRGKATDIRFEAESVENTLVKNDSVLRMSSDGDPATTPFKAGYAVMNTLGGSSWSGGGSSVTWQFNVETDGYYTLGMRLKQNYRDGLPTFRKILIDGAVPFSELEAYKFVYDKNWRYETLSNGDSPYYFWLEKGTHTLTMTATQGDSRILYDIIENDSGLISELVLDITMLTGQEPDPNYDYELEKYIPNLLDNLQHLIDNMEVLMKSMKEIAEQEPAKYHQLKSMILQLEKMIDDPFVIPMRVDELNTILNSYGTWLSEIRNQPLLLDYVEFTAEPNQTSVNSSFVERLYCGAVNFFMTFVKDYSSVSGYADNSSVKETLDVWIGRGTDWANLIKRMADEEFTPDTGVGIKINVLPAGQLNSGSANALLLAVSSGRAPDVSMGTATDSVGEFAMRNAVADLSAYSDFNDVKSRFLEQMFIPMTYKGGVYGLPETLNFQVMMYRKDIVSELGVHLPDTWEELREYVIPILYRNNMGFYLATTSFNTFLYQNGGSYYTDDLMYSAIGSSKGYQAFKLYTDLYTLYGVPVSASFFNRFRSGETPMGLVDFAMYMQITAAAPELVGKCGISLIPGMREADGSINRTYTGINAESVMIMEQSDQKDSAWEFIKWWTETSTQMKFGQEIESLKGETARWNTANIEAFSGMAWDKEDLNIILSSFDDVSQIPVVLGGYFTTRHITNAFNRTVVSGTDAMSSLEKAVKDINRELERRRK